MNGNQVLPDKPLHKSITEWGLTITAVGGALIAAAAGLPQWPWLDPVGKLVMTIGGIVAGHGLRRKIGENGNRGAP